MRIHILNLDGQRFRILERCSPLGGTQLNIEALDGSAPEAKWDKVFDWFQAITDAIPKDQSVHVIDPQHVLTS